MDPSFSSPPKAKTNRQPGEHPDDWRPNPGPQTRFLGLTCREALYGGAAGGGKSDALLVDAIRYVGRGYGSHYAALILRREFPDLEMSLMRRAWAIYPHLGGKFAGKTWTFPDGETVRFGHVQHENDIYQYQGAEFQYIAFDELTQFTETQYTYLISRLRSAHDVPLRLRATTNPGGTGHEWVFRRFGYWLDPSYPYKAEPGKVLYLVRDDGKEVVVDRGTEGALGRTFVPAKLSDNPYLARDRQYTRTLDELDPVTRKRLKDGNWLVKPAKGLYFKREWFYPVHSVDTPCERVRYWDLAASPTGDYAVGLRLAVSRDGRYYIEHVERLRGHPGAIRERVKETAQADGRAITVYIEQDPGQAGVDQIASYVTFLAGWTVRGRRKTQNKIVSAGPISSQAQARHVYYVEDHWNHALFEELEAFPEGDHDDQVDALSGAAAVLMGGVAPELPKHYDFPTSRTAPLRRSTKDWDD